MSAMMHNPWFYVALLALLVVLTVVPLVAVRVLAAREKRGGDLHDDPHLG